MSTPRQKPKHPCPNCGTMCDKRAKTCNPCRLAAIRARRVVHLCVSCGTAETHGAGRRCVECYRHEQHPFPRERVAVVVQKWLDAYHAQQELDPAASGQQRYLAMISGVSERGIYRILNGYSEHERGTGNWVAWDSVDKLFCAMDCVHLFHLPPEDGGFSDIYFNFPATQLEEAA